MGSMNLFQMVNCFLSFLLITVKNNKTTGVKNENADGIKLEFCTHFSKREHVEVVRKALRRQVLERAEVIDHGLDKRQSPMLAKERPGKLRGEAAEEFPQGGVRDP